MKTIDLSRLILFFIFIALGVKFTGTIGPHGLRTDEFHQGTYLPLDSYQILQHRVTTQVLSKLPKERHGQASKLITFAIQLAYQHQIGPEWVLAIMWTETHFRFQARSIKGAIGPMQVTLPTAHFIVNNLLKNRNLKAQTFISHPFLNVELGILYLKHLLQEFNFDIVCATIAYNMGPQWVKNQLKRIPKEQLYQHRYYKKVRSAYKKLTERALISRMSSL